MIWASCTCLPSTYTALVDPLWRYKVARSAEDREVLVRFQRVGRENHRTLHRAAHGDSKSRCSLEGHHQAGEVLQRHIGASDRSHGCDSRRRLRSTPHKEPSHVQDHQALLIEDHAATRTDSRISRCELSRRLHVEAGRLGTTRSLPHPRQRGWNLLRRRARRTSYH